MNAKLCCLPFFIIFCFELRKLQSSWSNKHNENSNNFIVIVVIVHSTEKSVWKLSTSGFVNKFWQSFSIASRHSLTRWRFDILTFWHFTCWLNLMSIYAAQNKHVLKIVEFCLSQLDIISEHSDTESHKNDCNWITAIARKWKDIRRYTRGCICCKYQNISYQMYQNNE